MCTICFHFHMYKQLRVVNYCHCRITPGDKRWRYRLDLTIHSSPEDAEHLESCILLFFKNIVHTWYLNCQLCLDRRELG